MCAGVEDMVVRIHYTYVSTLAQGNDSVFMTQ
jgi:hypothetical protein